MDHSSLLADVKTIIRASAEEPLELDAAAMGTPLKDLGLTSLDRITIVIAIEKRYGIEVTEDQFNDTSTLGDLVNLIASGSPAGG